MRRAVLAGSLAVALVALPAEAAVVEEFTVEDWSGLALTDDATGRLASCAIYSKYQNGATLFFIRHVDGNWTMSLVHDNWALAETTEYPARYRVDRNPFVDVSAVALDKDQMGVALSAEDPLISGVRRGKLLTVVFEGKEYGFELSNSRKALDGAIECIARHRDTVGPQVAEQPTSGGEPADWSVPARHTAGLATSQEGTAAAETPSTTSEASPIGERQTFGPWLVTATDDGAGTFVNCTAFGLYGDDQLIISHRPDDGWEFGLYRAAWALDVNQTYYLWYNVDAPAEGAGVIKRPVEAVEPTRIFFEVSGEEDLIAQMEGGRMLHLQLRGVQMEPQSFTYALDGIGPAFAAARECTRRNSEVAEAPEITPAPEATPAVAEAVENPKALPAIGATKIEDFEVPGWEGAAFTDGTGKFTHCAVQAEYENGTTLALLRTASGPLLMTLRRLDWALQPGAWTTLQYELKGTEPARLSSEALAIDAFLLAFDIGADETAAGRLKGATELAVTAQAQNLTFDISDIGPGLEALDGCAERHRAAAARPPAPSPGASKKSVGDGDPNAPGPASPERSPDRAQMRPDPPV